MQNAKIIQKVATQLEEHPIHIKMKYFKEVNSFAALP